jgi:hypothetical protein
MATIEEQIKAVAEKAVKEVRKDVRTHQGTAVADLTIKPIVELLSPHARSVETLLFRQFLRNAPWLSPEDVDGLMSNIFLARKKGAYATGIVRLFFSEPEEVRFGVNTLIVANSNGVQFSNPNPSYFSAADVRSKVEGDRFYIDINVQSVEKGKFKTEAGAVTKLVSSPGGPVSVINKDDFFEGAAQESNIDFAIRGEKSLSVRNLTTNPSISTVLKDSIDWLSDVRTIGYGDAEMKRDTINLQEIVNLLNGSTDLGTPVALPSLSQDDIDNFHVGNKTDIIIARKSLKTTSAVLTADETDFVTLLGDHNGILNLRTLTNSDGSLRFTFPIFDIVSVQQLNSELQPITLIDEIEEELDNPTNPNGFQNGMFRVEVMDTKLRMSVYEKLGLRLQSDIDELGQQVSLKNTLQGVPLKIVYRYSDGVQEVQDFVDDPQNKLLDADPMVKGQFPGFIDIYNINAPYSAEAPGTKMRVKLDSGKTIVDVVTEIEFFTNNSSTDFEVSDLIAYLYSKKVVTYVEQPLYLRLRVEDEERNLVEVSESPNTTRYDLIEIKKRHVGIISEIEVEEITEF